jgi:hypothetical protein
LLDHISHKSLCGSAEGIERQGRDILCRFHGKQEIANLRSVPVRDDNVIVPSEQTDQLPAGLLKVGELFPYCARLAGPDNGIATECNNISFHKSSII